MSKSVLCRAVRGDAEPTPGYILEELVRMSFVSRGVCAEVEGFLLNALEQKHKQADVYVKLKALRALRYLCEKGSSEFRISLRCKASQVKPFVTYTGESDPLHGDSLIKQVRAEAGKCISAIYGDEALSRQKQTNDGCEKTFSESQFYCYTPTNNSSTNPPAAPFGQERHSRAFTETSKAAWSSDGYKLPPKSVTNDRFGPRYGKMEGFGNPYFEDQFTRNEASRLGRPSVSTLSDVVATQTGQLVLGLSQAASSVGKFIPQSVKAQLEVITEKIALPTPLAGSVPSAQFGFGHPNNPYCSSSLSASRNSRISDGFKESRGTSVDFSDRFRFSGPKPFLGNSCDANNTRTFCSNNCASSQLASASRFPETQTKTLDCVSDAGRGESLSMAETSHKTFLNSNESNVTTAVNGDKNVAVTSNDVATLFFLAELIEETCGLASLGPATVADFVRRCRAHPQVSAAVPLLLCKMFPKIEHPVSKHRAVAQATTWKAKMRVLTLLAALAKRDEATPSQFHSLCASQIRELSAAHLQQLFVAAPKCRSLVQEVLSISGVDVKALLPVEINGSSPTIASVDLLDGEDHETTISSSASFVDTSQPLDTQHFTDLLSLDQASDPKITSTFDVGKATSCAGRQEKTEAATHLSDTSKHTLPRPTNSCLESSFNATSHNLLDFQDFLTENPKTSQPITLVPGPTDTGEKTQSSCNIGSQRGAPIADFSGSSHEESCHDVQLKTNFGQGETCEASESLLETRSAENLLQPALVKDVPPMSTEVFFLPGGIPVGRAIARHCETEANLLCLNPEATTSFANSRGSSTAITESASCFNFVK